MDKYKNKYRIGSHRKPNWDYSADALYFLTIVTQNRECILGDVIDSEMVLSEMGEIVNTEFLKSFEIRDELFLHEYVIMPNHLHMIVEICQPLNLESHDPTVEPHGSIVVEPDVPIVDTQGAIVDSHGRAYLQSGMESIKQNMPIRLPKSISSFMAGFKSAVNSQIDHYIDEKNLNISKYNRNNHFFQPNYHDHIIRNQFEHERIAHYIIENPENWQMDRLKNSDN